MLRYSLESLKTWLTSSTRKPLILRGARQVGKTWLVRELARQTNKQLIELNFESRKELFHHFESNDPKRILLNLESDLNQTIDPAHCLLFLDEIQAAPLLLAKLRWFYESLPELPVIAAGSLLEFVLEKHEFSMPVGRINYFFLEPLSFEEFLLAKNEDHLLNYLQQITPDNFFNDVLHKKASELFKEYMTVGGMPEAIASWINTNSLSELSQVHHDLINTYKDDFSKYAGRLSLDYLNETLIAIPKMLTKKFMYSRVNPNAKNSSIKQAVNLLIQARLAHYVKHSAANGIPLGAEVNPKVFKLILLDIGLTSTLLGLNLYQFNRMHDIMQINEGALAEQVAGQLLRTLFPPYIDPVLYYWQRESNNASAEIDYLIQNNERLIPIEVKAGSEGKLRSLHQFMHEKPWKMAVRIYSGPLAMTRLNAKNSQGISLTYDLLSVPFYLIEQLHRLIHH